MSVGQYILTTLTGLGVFLAIDLLWLGIVAPKVYEHYIGSYLAENPRWAAALIFYTLFVVGLVYFVIAPALEGGSLGQAALNGALLGGLAYATYELTNYAVIKDWPLGIVLIDIAWGMVLTSAVAAATYVVASKFIL